jgi:hypothetical protein
MGLFVMPFFLLYCTALMIGNAPLWQTAAAFTMICVGFGLISCAFEKFIINKKLSLFLSVVLGLIGLSVAFGAAWLF